MNWVLMALLAAGTWAVGNHIDKYILSKHNRGLGGLTIYAGVAGLLINLVFIAVWGEGQLRWLPVREAGLTFFPALFCFYIFCLTLRR